MPSHKVISRLYDLQEFGIQTLTGEACGIGMRILCDVNEDGKNLIEEFLGGTVKLADDSNWNRDVCGKPAVASIMLPYAWHAELGAFCLLKAGYDVVATGALHVGINTSAVGFMLEGKDLDHVMKESLFTRGKDFRTYHIHGTRGTRNVHVMSGRTS